MTADGRAVQAMQHQAIRERVAAETRATKRCTKCGEAKVVGEFGVKRKSPDGLQEWCRSCMSAYHRERRQSDPAWRAKKIEAVREYRRRHPRGSDYWLAIAEQNAREAGE